MSTTVKCYLCSTEHRHGYPEECRPYGPNKEQICFTCAMKTENLETTQRMMALEGLKLDLDPKYLIQMEGGGFRAPTEQELADIKALAAAGEDVGETHG